MMVNYSVGKSPRVSSASRCNSNTCSRPALSCIRSPVLRKPNLRAIPIRISQWHRTGKPLLGEQSLRRNATACPTRLIDATLDDDLASIGKPNTNNIAQIPSDEQNLHRPGSQKSSTPPVNPRRKLMHHQVTPAKATKRAFCGEALAWASVAECHSTAAFTGNDGRDRSGRSRDVLPPGRSRVDRRSVSEGRTLPHKRSHGSG